MSFRALLVLDIAAKAALMALLFHAVANPDLPQYADKAMQARAITYPLAVMVIPVAWFIRWRPRSFPVLSDLLFTLPFVIDTAGNALDLYDSIEWWDDANHFGNWVLLSAALVTLGWPRDADRWTRIALGVGFGAAAAIVWELLEYVTFIPDSPEAATAYEDTLGDMALGLLGALLGSSIAAWYVERKRAPDGPASDRPASDRGR